MKAFLEKGQTQGVILESETPEEKAVLDRLARHWPQSDLNYAEAEVRMTSHPGKIEVAPTPWPTP